MGDPMFFDGAAATYDQARPGYPEALYAQLGSLGVIRRGATVLEVGAGTGQAGWASTARSLCSTKR